MILIDRHMWMWGVGDEEEEEEGVIWVKCC